MAASKLSFEEEIKELLDVQDDVNLPNMAASKLSFEEEIKELHAFFL
jgi:exonuclease VII small subunit